MIIQGQELLEDRRFQDKVPIEWSRAEGKYGTLGMHRDLITLRRNLSDVTRRLCGLNIHSYHSNNEAKLIVFHRWDKQGPTDTRACGARYIDQNALKEHRGYPATRTAAP